MAAPDRPTASSLEARNRMRSVRQRDTAAELALRSELHRMGLRYRLHRKLLPDVRRVADLTFIRARVAVFVDGCFWHGCPMHATWPKANASFWREKIETNVRRDSDTDRRLREAGWLVVRVWEHEDPATAASRIQTIIRHRGPG